MKVAIIGTHFTGKTELADELYSFFKNIGKDVAIIKEVARKCPLPVNKDAKFEAQAWILAQQLKEEIEKSKHEILITDRSVIDNYAYSIWKFPEKARSLLHFVLEYANTYDYILKTVPRDVEIESDGFRDLDPDFRKEIDKILTGFLHGHGIKHHEIPKENTLNYVKQVIGYE